MQTKTLPIAVNIDTIIKRLTVIVFWNFAVKNNEAYFHISHYF